MAEIEIDLKIPGQESENINSPYSEINANVNLPENYIATIQTIESIQNTTDIYIPGQIGPIGPIGPSGSQGPSGAQGPQGPAGIVNIGELDLRYVNLTGDQNIYGIKNFISGGGIYISGNSVITGFINQLPSTIVYTNTNQTISSSKIFSGNNTTINFISGAQIRISGNNILTGIVGTGNFITINDLSQSQRNIYISSNGNDSTAQIGNINRPYLTAQAAFNAAISDGSNQYILNFYAGNWTINTTRNFNWPITLGVRGIGPTSSSTEAKPTLTITHNPVGSTTSPGPDRTIVDFGYHSIILNITSKGGGYAGGLSMNGGAGGNITLYNAIASTISSFGGNGGPGVGNVGGVAGNINLYNCEILISINSEGGLNGNASIYAFGGNVYAESSKINSINVPYFFSNPNPTNTITLIDCIYNPTTTLIKNITLRNSYEISAAKSTLSSSRNVTAGFLHDFSISNNSLSGILNNLTLHDNQNRNHATGENSKLTIDFASGINLASSVTGRLIPNGIANFLKMDINSRTYYIPMYTGIFTAL